MYNHSSHPTIELTEGISLSDRILDLTVVINSKKGDSQLAELFNMSYFNSRCGLILIRNNQSQYFLSYLTNDKGTSVCDKLVGLSEKVVCVDLSNEYESAIEKSYYHSLNNAYKFHFRGRTRLVFIKNSYRDKLDALEINYYESVAKMNEIINLHRPFFAHAISVKELLEIYSCDTEYIAKVRLGYYRVHELRELDYKIESINKTIFTDTRSRRELERYISGMRLPRAVHDKMCWKLKQYRKFKSLLEEDRVINANDYSKCTLSYLTTEVAHLWVVKCSKIWIANSLLRLKKLFNVIVNLRDTKAIYDFRSAHRAMSSRLSYIEGSLYIPYYVPNKTAKDEDYRKELYAYMSSYLAAFIAYHEAVLRDESLSSLMYLRKYAIFLWNYDNKVYKKIMVFGLIALLAYVQDNLIVGVALMSVAFICLAVRF